MVMMNGRLYDGKTLAETAGSKRPAPKFWWRVLQLSRPLIAGLRLAGPRSSVMDHDQAQFLSDYLCQLWEGEFPVTCKVLAAVPDDKRTYRPDERSRSAWELATHIATSDIWFADSIATGKFVFDPERAKQAAAQFSTVQDVVDFYKKEFPAAIGRLRALTPEQKAATVDFFGMMQRPGVTYLGLANNHSVHHRGQLAAYLRAMGSRCRRSTARAPTRRWGSWAARSSRLAVGADGQDRNS